ncbi:MAG: radical SAM protein, partial [Deltaproteobacteria bacterium]|nr:radical SAM protein [Deltaproteobacteria bacterium]
MTQGPADSPFRDDRKNVEINIGKTCNGHCLFCLDGEPSERDRAFMPWDELQSELRRWREDGYRSVGFLGGEPTVYPHIVPAVAYAAELGYGRIAVATKGLVLHERERCADLVAAGLTRVTLSMHGHTAALEDRLTRVVGAFDKKCQAIGHLRALRERGQLPDGLSVNAVLNAHNYRHLPKLLKFFFDELGLDDFRVNFVRPEGMAALDEELTPRFSDVVPQLMKAVVLNEHHFKKVFTFAGMPICVLPDELLSATRLLRKSLGDVYRDMATDCSIRSEGYDDGVSRVEGGRARFNWQDRKRRDLKHQAEVCRRCEASKICEGVWRDYLELHGADELSALGRRGDGFVRRRA